MRGFAVLAALGTLLLWAPEPAAAPLPEANQAARTHYQLGLDAFNAGNYWQAIDELEQAYAARPLPGLLLDLGACYRRTGDRAQALKYYRQYLREASPAARGRDAAATALSELTAPATAPRSAAADPAWLRALDDEPAPLSAAVRPPARPAPPLAAHRPRAGALFITGVVLASVGLAALAVGIAGDIEAHQYAAAIGADSRSPSAPIRFNDPSLSPNDRDYERQGHTWNSVGIVGTAVGAALVLGGAAMMVWERARSRERRRARAWYLAPQVGPRTAGLGAGVAW